MTQESYTRMSKVASGFVVKVIINSMYHDNRRER
jgi:hypothetical protein